MFDDEKENENWDNIDADIDISSDEPSWDDILDSAVEDENLSEEQIGEPAQDVSSYADNVDYSQVDNNYAQEKVNSEYEETPVYDIENLESDEPVVETTSQVRDTEDVSDLFSEDEEERKIDYKQPEPDTYDLSEEGNIFASEESTSAVDDNEPKPIGIKQDKKGSMMPIILGVLVAFIMAYGGYAGYSYLTTNNMLPGLNNSAKADLENKNNQEDNDMFDDFGADANQQGMPNEQKPQLQQPQQPQQGQIQGQPQAQDAQKDKVVVTVTNTGRTNPFTPTGNFSEAGYTIPKGLDIMAPPPYDKDVTPNKLVDIVVSGILYDNLKPSAIITIGGMDHFVQRGDSIDEYIVSSISPTQVTIRKGKNSYTASIGQSFDIKGRIAGETTYVKTKNGVIRQYYTPSEEDAKESY